MFNDNMLKNFITWSLTCTQAKKKILKKQINRNDTTIMTALQLNKNEPITFTSKIIENQ